MQGGRTREEVLSQRSKHPTLLTLLLKRMVPVLRLLLAMERMQMDLRLVLLALKRKTVALVVILALKLFLRLYLAEIVHCSL